MISQIQGSSTKHSVSTDSIASQAQDHFDSVSWAVQSQSETSITGFADIQTSVQNLVTSGESQNNLVVLLLRALEEKMQVIQTMSVQQAESIQSKIDQLHVQNRPSCSYDNAGHHISGAQEDRVDCETITEVQGEIDKALESLRSYAHVIEQTVYCNEVDPIITTLDTILKLLLEPRDTEDASRKRNIDHSDVDPKVYDPSPKRLRRLVAGAQHVIVNGKGLCNHILLKAFLSAYRLYSVISTTC